MHPSATDHNACAYVYFVQTRLAKAKVLLVSQLLQVNALAFRCSKFDVQSQDSWHTLQYKYWQPALSS